MSAEGQNLLQFINKWVRNSAVDAFHNLRLNSILQRLANLADAASGGVGTGSFVVEVTQADFSNATDCPLIALNGKTFALFYDESSRHLHQDAAEWSYLAGGGFKILMDGFDATAVGASFHFVIYVK